MKLKSYTQKRVINLRPASEISDRAKRYRARNATPGPKKCVVCDSSKNLQAMHLSGDETDGDPSNLAWGCRSCNQVLSTAYIAMGSTMRTVQFNPPDKGRIPSYGEYIWAVTRRRGANVSSMPSESRSGSGRRKPELRPKYRSDFFFENRYR